MVMAACTVRNTVSPAIHVPALLFRTVDLIIAFRALTLQVVNLTDPHEPLLSLQATSLGLLGGGTARKEGKATWRIAGRLR